MKKIIIKICLVLGFLYTVEDVANAFPGTKEYNYKYNKKDYVYIMPTYVKSWGTQENKFNKNASGSPVDSFKTKSPGFIIGLTGEGIGLEFSYQEDYYNFTPNSDSYYNSYSYYNIEANSYDIKFTFLLQMRLDQGDNTAIAPYIGTGITYSNIDFSYTYEDRWNNIYDYNGNISGFGWQTLKIGTKVCYRHLIADVGFDFILGFGAISKGNLYMSLGARF